VALTGPTGADGAARPVRAIPLPELILLAVVVGCVGGIYGIGGGSILALRVTGILVVAFGARYLWSGLS
jgi:hypothetical protein